MMNNIDHKTKKKILIYWGNPYIFYEAMVPLISKLSRFFFVSVILPDSYVPAKLPRILELMRKKGELENYWLVPSPREVLKCHRYIKSKLEAWQKNKFDFFLSATGIEIVDRYLLECALPKHCRRICFYPALGYLLRDRELVDKLLSGDKGSCQQVTQKNHIRQANNSKLRNYLQKLRQAKSLALFLRLIIKAISSRWAYIKGRFNNLLERMYLYHFNYILLPFMFKRKMFFLSKQDQRFRITTNKIDDFIFCDDIEAKAYGALFKNLEVYAAKHPSSGNCHCHGDKQGRTAILVPLAGLGGAQKVAEDFLSVIKRDLLSVLRESGAKTIHLRPHPRYKEGGWPIQLRDYLRNSGIDAHLTKPDIPIREIVCDYVGVAGFASSSLRDARGACDYIFVVGFEEVSRVYYSNPKRVFGVGEGIGWVNDGGNYSSDIFKRQKHVSLQEKGVEDILLELSGVEHK